MVRRATMKRRSKVVDGDLGYQTAFSPNIYLDGTRWYIAVKLQFKKCLSFDSLVKELICDRHFSLSVCYLSIAFFDSIPPLNLPNDILLYSCCLQYHTGVLCFASIYNVFCIIL